MEKELQEMNNIMEDIIKIFEIDDVICRYRDLLSDLDNVAESEKYAHIQNHLLLMDYYDECYQKELDNIVAKFNLSPSITLRKKIELVLDYVVAKLTYSESVRNMYETVRDNLGRCYNISKLTVDLLQKLNIKAKVVKGYSSNEFHAWVMIIYDNEEWYFDPTFEIHDGDKEKWRWKSKKEFSVSHTPIYYLI